MKKKIKNSIIKNLFISIQQVNQSINQPETIIHLSVNQSINQSTYQYKKSDYQFQSGNKSINHLTNTLNKVFFESIQNNKTNDRGLFNKLSVDLPATRKVVNLFNHANIVLR